VVGVKFMNNLPSNVMKVRPHKFLIEPMQQVKSRLVFRPPLPENVDPLIMVSSSTFAPFVTMDIFDNIWEQARNRNFISEQFLAIVHRKDNENPLQPGVFTFHANDALNVAIRPDANPGWGNAANTEWSNEIITGSGDNNQVVANNQEWNTDQWANQQNPVETNEELNNNPPGDWGDANSDNAEQQNNNLDNQNDNIEQEPAQADDWAAGGWGDNNDDNPADTDQNDEAIAEDENNDNIEQEPAQADDCWAAGGWNDNAKPNDGEINDQGFLAGNSNQLVGAANFDGCHHTANNNAITGNPLIDALIILVGVLIFGILIGKGVV